MQTKQTIAVIEDDEPIQRMYKFKLESSGFAVCCASDGRAGLEIIESFRPKLVLLDIMMPIIRQTGGRVCA